MSAELERAVRAALFHYWNCNGGCGALRYAMARLAEIVGYSDPAVDDDIRAVLAQTRKGP